MLGELRSPWSIDRFRKDMDDLFDRFFGDMGYRGRGPTTSVTMSPALESFFKDSNWIIRVDLPGVDPKDMDVSVAGDTLTIRASRHEHSEERTNVAFRGVSYGSFERCITLPEGVKVIRSRPTIRMVCWS